MSDIKQALKNIFATPAPSVQVVTVVRRIRAGRYEVEDGAGRLFPVNSAAQWSPGDSVSVQSGRITESATATAAGRVYEV